MAQQSTIQPQRRRSGPIWLTILLLLALLPLQSPAQTAPVSATTIPLILPSSIVFDTQGNFYLAETASHIIRKVDIAGTITTIAGTGTQGFSGDAGPATAAQLDSPQGLALDASQNLYIADTHNHRIRKLNLATGTITTIAGSTPSFDGDSGSATAAHLNLPTALALDTTGNLYIADTQNHRIRKITTSTGSITTIVGNGIQGFSGDYGPAISASIDSPTGITLDPSGNLYLADTHNHRIRKVTGATGIITTIAGTATAGYNGDNGSATTATLALPHGLTIDAAGNLYLADTANHRIRRIDATTGIITTIAGQGTQTYSGDAGPATTASLDTPRTTTTSSSGLLTLADTGNQRIRQISTDNTIHTIAGLGSTTPGTLSLTAPSTIVYGTGQLIATLATATNASGIVTFLDTFDTITTTLGTATLTVSSASSGAATSFAVLSTSTLPAGNHSIVATYAGDQTHPSAQSSALSLTVAPQQLMASITPAKLLYGQPIPALNGSLAGLLPRDASLLSATFTTTAANLSPTGAYPFTATLSGPAAGNYILTTSPSSLVITPAPTVTTLTASATTLAPGLPITLNAHVASTTAGTPTGTITLLDGPTTLFTTDVSSTGDAAFTTSSLTTGLHSLITVYAGEANFTPSASTPQLIGIGTSPTSDFTLTTTGPATQTITAGSSASFTFAVQLQGNPLSSPITLAATGLPPLAIASFNPTYLPPGTTSNTFNLTITTPKTTALHHNSIAPSSALALLLFPMAGLALCRRDLRKKAILFTWVFLTISITLCSGCGDRIYPGNQATTSPKTYNITVTGTATTPTGTPLTHATTVILLLQPAN
ncbi:MAG TPA: Ig-like domain repeat protein [Edaphobacter sp.]|nr:Ig-like domain repeat protein [Edaphobacter sp.]